MNAWIVWLITAVALVGTWLNVRKRRAGFACWMASNFCFVVHNGVIGEWPQAVMFSVFLVLAVWGWFAWGTKAPERTAYTFTCSKCFRQIVEHVAKPVLHKSCPACGYYMYVRGCPESPPREAPRPKPRPLTDEYLDELAEKIRRA